MNKLLLRNALLCGIAVTAFKLVAGGEIIEGAANVACRNHISSLCTLCAGTLARMPDQGEAALNSSQNIAKISYRLWEYLQYMTTCCATLENLEKAVKNDDVETVNFCLGYAEKSKSISEHFLNTVIKCDAVRIAQYLVCCQKIDWKKAVSRPFERAINAGALDTVEYFVKHQWADVHQKDERGGEIPLYWAMEQDNPAMIKKLVNLGADVHNMWERTLSLAAGQGRLKALRAAVALGADPHRPSESDSILEFYRRGEGVQVDTLGIYPDLPLRWAAGKGQLPVVKFLVEECGADVHANNDAAIVWAAYGWHTDVVDYLLDKGCDIQRALSQAAERGNLDMVKHLVENKHADIAANNGEAIGLAQRNLDFVTWVIEKEAYSCYEDDWSYYSDQDRYKQMLNYLRKVEGR